MEVQSFPLVEVLKLSNPTTIGAQTMARALIIGGTTDPVVAVGGAKEAVEVVDVEVNP